MPESGYIYVLATPAIPDMVKVGKTSRKPAERARELSGTGLPIPYVVVWQWMVTDTLSAERAAHSALADHRVSRDREHFNLTSQEAVEMLKDVLADYSIPELITPPQTLGNSVPQMNRKTSTIEDKLRQMASIPALWNQPKKNQLGSGESLAPRVTSQGVLLVCPKCQEQARYEMSFPYRRQSLVCLSCRSCFQSLITRIVAKKSGRNGWDQRYFSIRVAYFDGGEEQIEFMTIDAGDFSLRSKDQAGFSFHDGELRIVQNLTSNQFMAVSTPSKDACYLATMVYGADSDAVLSLRAYRDEVLLANSFTTSFVNWYYHVSPMLVQVLGRFRLFHSVVRLCLVPIVWAIQRRERHDGKLR